MGDETGGLVNHEIKLGSGGESVPGSLGKTDAGFLFVAQIPDLGPREGNSLAVDYWDTEFCSELDKGGAASPEMNAFGYSTDVNVRLDGKRNIELKLLRRDAAQDGDSRIRDRVLFVGAESEAEVDEVLSHIRIIRCNIKQFKV